MSATDEGPLIAVVESNRDASELLAAILEDEGHRVAAFIAGPDSLDIIRELRPDLLVVTVEPNGPGLALLDAVRQDPAAHTIPVIALSTMESLQEQAQASGNVFTVLPMPFELDQLLSGVGAALARTPVERRLATQPVAGDAGLRQAAEILAQAEREIMLAWAQRVRTLPAFAGFALSLGEFLDNLPRVLHAIAVILRHEEPPSVALEDPDLLQRIRQHAETRLKQGMASELCVHEYQALREVIGARLRRDLPAETVLDALTELNGVLDMAMRVTIAEYHRLAGEMAP
jgi:DNA-binding response OmpR family regulator